MAVVESSHGHIPSSPFSDLFLLTMYHGILVFRRCDFRFSCYNFVFIIYGIAGKERQEICTFVTRFRCEDSRGDKKREENEFFFQFIIGFVLQFVNLYPLVILMIEVRMRK